MEKQVVLHIQVLVTAGWLMQLIAKLFVYTNLMNQIGWH